MWIDVPYLSIEHEYVYFQANLEWQIAQSTKAGVLLVVDDACLKEPE